VKSLARFFLFLLLALLLAGGGAGFYAYHAARNFLNTPANVALGEEERFFYLEVPLGSSLDQVAERLYAEGGISDARKFRLLGRWKRVAGRIKAGEFEFSTGWKPGQVLDQLVSGRSLLHRVTIPEGLPWWEVGRILEENGFARFADFEACVKDARLMRRYGIPFATAEGFLFPDTYMLDRPSSITRAHAENIVAVMVQNFWTSTSAIWQEAAHKAGLRQGEGVEVTASGQVIASFVPLYARKFPAEVKNLVILASLTEKESAVPEERPRVSGVYVNRLRAGMLLQCDPTIIYGLGPGFKGPILRSQLRDASNLYNTYKFAGLPPGPICSPGLQALDAAFRPEDHRYLYFVATGKPGGRHVFSRTLAEHDRAVQDYRKATERR
jgi:UPF0755 protein